MRNVDGPKHFYRIGQFVKKQIEEHRKTFQPGDIRDFVDIYLESELETDGNQKITGEYLKCVVQHF